MISAGVFGSFGGFILFFLGALLSWRKVALICVSVPVVVIIAMIFVSLFLYKTKNNLIRQKRAQ